MHPEALAFVKANLPKELDGLRVAEVGSYDVNGSPRGLFSAAKSYTGYDVRPGPGVDEVKDVSAWTAAPRFDVVVSTETLEHAPDPRALLEGMSRALKPGGSLILTAAAPERTPHAQDGTSKGPPAGEPYQNIAPDDLRAWLRSAGLRVVTVEHHPRRGDVYALAKKPQAKDGGEG
jgi:SAM-dependent methyltransferase